MKKIFLIPVILIALIGFALQQKAQDNQQHRPLAYEYATVRFMGGGRTAFVWPDGKVQKLSDINPAKRPDTADERMFYLTIAMNILAQRGYEPATMPSIDAHADDIWARRLVSR